jgi:crotonobetainyl-CoA:carnitine CoA-transferase CaiB-like acyl-CoA transferase
VDGAGCNSNFSGARGTLKLTDQDDTPHLDGPLAGIRVLEVANFIAGPYAGALLADLGADVVKVENPDGGDPFRGWNKDGEAQTAFWAYNRGKQSIVLNLREAAGRDVLRTLASTADVLLENMRPGVMDRLGVGYEYLRTLNPKLIYCSVSGFGQSGPYAQRPAYDGVGQALSGLVSLLTDVAAPQPVGPNFSDSLGGLFAAYGILGALVARATTGIGQRVDTSLVGATLGFLVAPATDTLAGNPPPGPRSRPISSQTYAWTASDGLPFTVHLSSPAKFWQGLAQTAGLAELIDDPRYRTQNDRRVHYDVLHAEFARVFATRTRAEWLDLLTQADVPCAPIYDLGEVFNDPQVEHMGLEITLPRGERGPVRTVASPISYSDTPVPLPAPPPDLGQHTASVLQAAGYNVADIAALLRPPAGGVTAVTSG